MNFENACLYADSPTEIRDSSSVGANPLTNASLAARLKLRTNLFRSLKSLNQSVIIENAPHMILKV
jgi:hypothetical protein